MRLSLSKKAKTPRAKLVSPNPENGLVEDGVELRLATSNDSSVGETIDPSRLDSPAIMNNTEFPIVVFMERGILYQPKVLRPGEVVTFSRKQTGGYGLKLPYKVHVVLGDEASMPTTTDSLKNLAKVSVVPTAFVAGCLATAVTAGTLAGPSLALAPLVSGMVVKGVVIDAAALAGGAFTVDMTKKVAAKVFKDHQEQLMAVTSNLKPGKRFLSVTGGLRNGPLEIESVHGHVFERLELEALERPYLGQE
jgi:hypothetical protein